MSKKHGSPPDFDKALKFIGKLERPTFAYSKDGTSVYIPAGHTFLTFSAYPVGNNVRYLANPSKGKLYNTKRLIQAKVDGVVTHYDCEDHGFVCNEVKDDIQLWEKVLDLVTEEGTNSEMSKADVRGLGFAAIGLAMEFYSNVYVNVPVLTLRSAVCLQTPDSDPPKAAKH